MHPSALEGIKDELQILSDRVSDAGYQENDADTRAMCELAENLRDTILEHQVSTDLNHLSVYGINAEVTHSSFNRKHCMTRIVN